MYIFKDHLNVPIYIGKAKSLKKRVGSYFNINHKDWKADFLLEEINDVDYIITKNETEALLLEANLIQKYQPKFNVLLRNGQPFIYILVSKSNLPQLKLVRNKKEKGIYFGPFLYKGQARSIYNFLISNLQLKICNKTIANGCLQFHLGKCAGSCKEDFNKEAYLFRLQLAQDILNGKSQTLIDQILEQIKKYNTSLDFEQSQKLNHILENLHHITQIIKLRFNPTYYTGDINNALSNQQQPHAIGAKLTALLNLKFEPKTIDCFDISHFQSQSIVGSCIRFVNGIPDKNNFRRFKIKTLQTQDDYAALGEIVQRRYKNPTDIPDLVLIDGGKGQLNCIQKLFPYVPILSLAKKDEILFSSTYTDGKKIDLTTDEGRMLIALRDYAHHFAITYHRTKRGKLLTA